MLVYLLGTNTYDLAAFLQEAFYGARLYQHVLLDEPNPELLHIIYDASSTPRPGLVMQIRSAQAPITNGFSLVRSANVMEDGLVLFAAVVNFMEMLGNGAGSSEFAADPQPRPDFGADAYLTGPRLSEL